MGTRWFEYELAGTSWSEYELVLGTSWLPYELAWYDLVRVRVSKSKYQKSRSPGRYTQRGLNTSQDACSGQRGNVYSVWESIATYVVSARRRARRSGAHGKERGGGYRVATRSAYYYYLSFFNLPRPATAATATTTATA